jgi:hypothetical protein
MFLFAISDAGKSAACPYKGIFLKKSYASYLKSNGCNLNSMQPSEELASQSF